MQYIIALMGQVVQAARRLATGCTARVRSRVSEGRDFSSLPRVKAGHVVYSVSYKINTGGFPEE